MTEQSYILYIEDERATIKLVQEMLHLSGFHVIGATSGEEGLNLMRDHKPDLLLLDLMMPNTSGFDVYRTMKNDRTLRDIPVIIISAKIPADNYTIIAELPPVDDYVTKPFDLNRLIRSIKKTINSTIIKA